ncbi:hypothetical protein CEXT_635791 [Caerostris extrusa]|uniref:Uncharacterized protein n=1 Tax=Caerostris extrusa TaxID=172846 RepID=A0AAV4MGR3_CAEEX|nr:hypothetical protein CEXT_635791 [Caerostris extrusa]
MDKVQIWQPRVQVELNDTRGIHFPSPRSSERHPIWMRGGKGGCRVLICKQLTIPDAEAIKEGSSEKCGSKRTGCLQLRSGLVPQ